MRLRLAACLLTATAFLSACITLNPARRGDPWGGSPQLPEPAPQKLIPTVRIAKVIGWPEGKTPTAPVGFVVTKYAGDLDHPRWLYVLPNGDVLVSEASTQPHKNPGIKEHLMHMMKRRGGSLGKSANRITLLRDSDGDGDVDFRSVFLSNLNQPLGMALKDGTLYVANTDAVVAYPYTDGATKITGEGRVIARLPAGAGVSSPGHWTRNLQLSPDGSKLYVSIGSVANIGEDGMDREQGRGEIREIDLATGQMRTYASGLRNPNGMDFEAVSGKLWTVVNERDLLGDDTPPDYMTSVQDGGFYGWPWAYWGQTVDERVKPPRPDMVARSIRPDFALGAHTASLGLTFYRANAFPARYRGGAFVGQHGSWNRSSPAGYKVVFVPFANGMPSGPAEDFLTGFLAPGNRAYGRPVAVAVDRTGALLVTDDAGDVVWRVAPTR